MLRTLRCLCVCMVAQLHALLAQQSKHLLSVEFSYREHCHGIDICFPKSTKDSRYVHYPSVQLQGPEYSRGPTKATLAARNSRSKCRHLCQTFDQ